MARRRTIAGLMYEQYSGIWAAIAFCGTCGRAQQVKMVAITLRRVAHAPLLTAGSLIQSASQHDPRAASMRDRSLLASRRQREPDAQASYQSPHESCSSTGPVTAP
jgi:hypothetical protein